MSSFFKKLTAAASKVSEMVGMDQPHSAGMDGDPLDESRAKIAHLRASFADMKKTISDYARHLHVFTSSGAQLSTEWAGLYSHSQARSNSLQCFTSTSTRVEEFGLHLSRDAIPWEVMKVFDDWDAEAARMRGDVEKTAQAKVKVGDLEEKVRALRASKEKRLRKNEALSDKEETQLEASEQMLDKYSGLLANMRVNLDQNLSHFYDQRFSVLDAAFVRFMELQQEMWRNGAQAVGSYSSIIDNYRKRFPLENGRHKYPIPDVSSPLPAAASALPSAVASPTSPVDDDLLNGFTMGNGHAEALAAAAPKQAMKHQRLQDDIAPPVAVAPKQAMKHQRLQDDDDDDDEDESFAPVQQLPSSKRQPLHTQSATGNSSSSSTSSPGHVRHPTGPIPPKRGSKSGGSTSKRSKITSSDSDTETASDESETSESEAEEETTTQHRAPQKSNSKSTSQRQAQPPAASNSMDILGFSSDDSLPPTRVNSSATMSKPPSSRQTSTTTTASAVTMSTSDFSFDWSGGSSSMPPVATTSAPPPRHLPESHSSPALQHPEQESGVHAFDPFGAPSPAANTKQHSMPQRSASTASTQSSSRQPQLQHQQSHPARSASPTYLPSTAGLASHVHAESEKKILALREAEAAQEAALEARRDAEMNVDARLQAWECNKDGSKKNIRNLLSTVHTVLWPNSGWKPLGIADLIDFAGIKKAHMKLIRIVHPDKMIDVTPEQMAIGLRVFDTLNTAFDQFKAEQGM